MARLVAVVKTATSPFSWETTLHRIGRLVR